MISLTMISLTIFGKVLLIKDFGYHGCFQFQQFDGLYVGLYFVEQY